ncbi:DeoR/GlpR family DNA-binding transcription regulator [Pediococcus inopinatus]|uniref:Lactose phosphotransferase system repressor n=1 Tax=Pediococcus inopinatus TaxID=114090 RepID=A0ABZ0Q5G0_9LACO|nr:DeoR/GlpR family DNA-binding transcription regulator [Pediococcus inopinatus]AVK99458.1 DeoR family transcriptional regulator [Pediococcus inopinatus]KRN62132.1 lactose phosphotransferase system repressor [Pediococcus inopinatus]WPC17228.1 DeoR/GlpR family DNA-binding transcription regulator [Pediococcus inopinatus]WPC20503.1 DeoR/GlpR family DNA-binding transcription regulator [Pediococcus inopinatus]WPC22206.1 DeoR/GlpR family DNA-binding transcription regulator [Pediococcus inopinatus]
MLKNERVATILSTVNQSGVVTVQELVNELNVSSMTIRRDLEELEQEHRIVRVHGGAQSIHTSDQREASYIQKRKLHVAEKSGIAQQVASMIAEDETIFLGPGTTNELVSKYLNLANLRIVTNSLPVFEQFRNEHSEYELFLVGGTYRERSGAFIGSLANGLLKNLKMHKAFVGVNGINGNSIMNANSDEGQTQSIALDQAQKKFVVADHSKLNRNDFYAFYHLDKCDGLITDQDIDSATLQKYQKLTKVYNSTNKKQKERFA